VLKGFYAALPTPFTADGARTHEDALGRLVRRNLDAGLAGLYVGGSTGEAFLMSEEERARVLAVAAEAAAGQGTLIAHVGDPDPELSARLALAAERLGYHAISAVPPFYYRYSFAEIAAHYAWLAGRTGLPFLIYNFPDLSGVRWSAGELAELLALPGVVGVKNTCADLHAFERLRAAAPEKVLLHGFDETLLAGLAMGADGGIGSTYNLQPARILELAAAQAEGRSERARALQAEANGLIDAMLAAGVMPALKYLLELEGLAMGPCRRPFQPLADDARRALDEAATRYLDNGRPESP